MIGDRLRVIFAVRLPGVLYGTKKMPEKSR
jgi:hypothetical protein